MEKISYGEDNPQGIFARYKIGTKMRVGEKTGNPLRDWEDGTFTIYFAQAGTPYYFKPITNMPNPFIDENEANTRNQEEANETFDPIEPIKEADLQANGTVY